MDIYQEIISELKKVKNITFKEVNKIKNALSKKYKFGRPPTNFEILLQQPNVSPRLRKALLTKPIRTLSGVSPVAIMCIPHKCPHGKCIYCPGGVDSFFGDVPQSYTGHEPATMRAIRNQYDPYLQVFNRLEQYVLLGHNANKIELIVMGGTFPCLNTKYKENFVMYAYKAMNDFAKMFFRAGKLNIERFKKFFHLPHDPNDPVLTKKLRKKILELKNKNVKDLDKEKKRNESSFVRCVALCIETRPDWCDKKIIDGLLRLGTTRVELGVQHIDNKVLKAIKRGHSVEDTIEATQLLRDSFIKVGYHMMIGLPGSTKKKDIDMVKKIFDDPRFKPDTLKIYPTLILKGTELYDLYKKKKYKPLSIPQAVNMIKDLKKFIPKYCRVMRVQRDISTKELVAGPMISNLRQMIHEKEDYACDCIRCREPRKKEVDFSSVKMLRTDYDAGNGKEIFLSFEDTENNILLGFVRVRVPFNPFRKEITSTSAGVRQLHVYGAQTKLGEKGKIQHRGLGQKLMKEAEKIAKEFECNKLIVISGIGVREYYVKKLGYKRQGAYVVKKLK